MGKWDDLKMTFLKQNWCEEIIEKPLGLFFLVLGVLLLIFSKENAYQILGISLMSFGLGIILGQELQETSTNKPK